MSIAVSLRYFAETGSVNGKRCRPGTWAAVPWKTVWKSESSVPSVDTAMSKSFTPWDEAVVSNGDALNYKISAGDTLTVRSGAGGVVQLRITGLYNLPGSSDPAWYGLGSIFNRLPPTQTAEPLLVTGEALDYAFADKLVDQTTRAISGFWR